MADAGYRPLGFESDVGNRNFQGATDPDSLLHVEFYWDEGLDANLTEAESIKQQKLVRIKRPKTIYVRIMVPGDKSSIIERAKIAQDEIRWPKPWRWFQMSEGLVERNENDIGWKVDEWDELNDDERRDLKFKRFYTVEQIAGASDAQLGMIGMGADGLRLKARTALKNRSGAAMAEKDKIIADLAARLDRLEKGSPPAPQTVTPLAQTEPVPAVAEGKARTMTPEHKAKLKAGREAARARKAAA